MIPTNDNFTHGIEHGFIHLTEHGPALVRAFRSLTNADVDQLTRAVREAAPGWSAQVEDDYDGYRFVLLERTSEPTANQPSYLVSGTTREIVLTRIDGDSAAKLGSFAAMRDLTERLLEHLGSSAFVE